MSFVIDNSTKFSNFKGQYLYNRKVRPLINDTTEYRYKINDSDIIQSAYLKTKHLINNDYKPSNKTFKTIYQEYDGMISSKLVKFPYQYSYSNEHNKTRVVIDKTEFTLPVDNVSISEGYAVSTTGNQIDLIINSPVYRTINPGPISAVKISKSFIAVAGGTSINVYTKQGSIYPFSTVNAGAGIYFTCMDIFESYDYDLDIINCKIVAGSPSSNSNKGSFVVATYNPFTGIFNLDGVFTTNSIGNIGKCGFAVSVSIDFLCVSVISDALGSQGSGRINIYSHADYNNPVQILYDPEPVTTSEIGSGSNFGYAISISQDGANQIVVSCITDESSVNISNSYVFEYVKNVDGTYPLPVLQPLWIYSKKDSIQSDTGGRYITNRGSGFWAYATETFVKILVNGEINPRVIALGQIQSIDSYGSKLIVAVDNKVIIYEIVQESTFYIPFTMLKSEDLIVHVDIDNLPISQELILNDLSYGSNYKEPYGIFYENPIYLPFASTECLVDITCMEPIQCIKVCIYDSDNQVFLTDYTCELIINSEVICSSSTFSENCLILFVNLIDVAYIYTGSIKINYDSIMSTGQSPYNLYVFYDTICAGLSGKIAY